jgi:hypothetical protein
MRRSTLAVAAAGRAIAVAAESATHLPEELGWRPPTHRRPCLHRTRPGRLGAAAAGPVWSAHGRYRFAWLACSFVDAALFLHRGPLVHLLVGYPRGRLGSRLVPVVVEAAYVDAAVYPLACRDTMTIALALAVMTSALVRYLRAGGPERPARAAALAAASAGALVLGLAQSVV